MPKLRARRRNAVAIASMIAAMVASACASAPARAPASRVAAAPATEGAAGAPADDEEPTDEESDGEASSEAPAAGEERGPCPSDMALVADRVCVDKYEASLVEVLSDGTERPYPNNLPVDGHVVRAVSVAGVLPQGFISEVQAEDACRASGKRLCTHEEWKTACMGPAKTTFPYGDVRKPGACHDTGKSAVVAVFGAKAVAASTPYPGGGVTAAPRTSGPRSPKEAGKERKAHATKGRAASTTRARAAATSATATKTTSSSSRTGKPGSKSAARRGALAKKSQKPMSVDPGVWAKLNDPALGRVEGALAKTGDHVECVNGWGLYDMVGNLHEWVATDASLPNGTFAGGYYLDTTINGDGCNYRTVAHAHDYHDYSTGFRCCADPRAATTTTSSAALPRLPR
jgi:hypothetical protein